MPQAKPLKRFAPRGMAREIRECFPARVATFESRLLPELLTRHVPRVAHAGIEEMLDDLIDLRIVAQRPYDPSSYAPEAPVTIPRFITPP
jgi:hypothetical protein